MKPPVYKGPRKGYSAFWLVDIMPTKDNLYAEFRYRLRHLDSKGQWLYRNLNWFYDGHEPCIIPCWVSTHGKSISAMEMYDIENGIECEFLGYVKDTE